MSQVNPCLCMGTHASVSRKGFGSSQKSCRRDIWYHFWLARIILTSFAQITTPQCRWQSIINNACNFDASNGWNINTVSLDDVKMLSEIYIASSRYNLDGNKPCVCKVLYERSWTWNCLGVAYQSQAILDTIDFLLSRISSRYAECGTILVQPILAYDVVYQSYYGLQLPLSKFLLASIFSSFRRAHPIDQSRSRKF